MCTHDASDHFLCYKDIGSEAGSTASDRFLCVLGPTCVLSRWRCARLQLRGAGLYLASCSWIVPRDAGLGMQLHAVRAATEPCRLTEPIPGS